eukprot:1399472-Rhodomonas_salina.3
MVSAHLRRADADSAARARACLRHAGLAGHFQSMLCRLSVYVPNPYSHSTSCKPCICTHHPAPRSLCHVPLKLPGYDDCQTPCPVMWCATTGTPAVRSCDRFALLCPTSGADKRSLRAPSLLPPLLLLLAPYRSSRRAEACAPSGFRCS